MSDKPVLGLVAFLEHLQHYDGMRATFIAQLGRDVDYLIGTIDKLLVSQIEQSLASAFAGRSWTVPLPIVAQSIAGMYVKVIWAWFMDRHGTSPVQLAQAIQRLSRAVICESL